MLTSGSDDHTVPKAVTLEVLKMYEQNPSVVTSYLEFAGRGHSLTIDSGWREVADATLDWLESQKLEADVPASAPPV